MQDSLVLLYGLIAYSFLSHIVTSIVWIAYYSPTEGPVGYFQHVLSIINKISKNLFMQIFMWTLHLFLKLKLTYIFKYFFVSSIC